MLKSMRGISNVGCLVLLALVVCAGFAGYKFAQVQWNLESFKEQMTEATRFFANEKGDDVMLTKNDVIRRAKACGFELDPENITVASEGPDLMISVSWMEPILFPGGYVFNRPITVTRRIRKFGY